MSILTPNINLIKPAVNSAVDEDLWGDQLNDNLDTIDDEAILATVDKDWADKTLSQPKFKDSSEEQTTPSSSSGTLTLDNENGNIFEVTLFEAVTLVILNAPITGDFGSFVFKFIQDGTGGWPITFPASVDWPGGAPPVITTDPGNVTSLQFYTTNAGTTWLGFLHGDNIS